MSPIVKRASSPRQGSVQARCTTWQRNTTWRPVVSLLLLYRIEKHPRVWHKTRLSLLITTFVLRISHGVWALEQPFVLAAAPPPPTRHFFPPLAHHFFECRRNFVGKDTVQSQLRSAVVPGARWGGMNREGQVKKRVAVSKQRVLIK